jgi:hypothetical protein
MGAAKDLRRRRGTNYGAIGVAIERKSRQLRRSADR